MEVKEASRAGADELKGLRQETELLNLTVQQFTSNAVLVNAAYTQALGQVNAALKRLSQQFAVVATVGLNAFANLLNGLQPLARQLSNLVTSIFGVKVWTTSTKAAEGTASAISKVAKSTRAAAKAQKELYSFDQITRVTAKSGSSSSGSSGGGSSSAAGEPEVIKRLSVVRGGLLARVWQPFRKGWEAEGLKVTRAANQAMRELGSALSAVGQSWLKIWTNGSGEKAVTTVLQIVRQMLDSVGSLAARFSEAWKSWNKGERIFSNLGSAVQNILDHIYEMASATAQWAEGLDLNGLVRGFLNVMVVLKPLSDLIGGALSWGYTNVLLPLGKWVIEAAGPAALNLLASGLQALTSVLNALAPIAQTVWNGVLKPLGNWTCSVLITGLELAKQGFQSLSNVFSSIPAKWQQFKTNALNLWQSFTGSLSGSASSCRTGLLSIFSSIGTGIQQKLSNVKTALTTPFKNGFNGVIELANKVIKKLNSALKFSWDPIKVMGKTVAPGGSVTLAKIPTIPKLADGGVVTGPTLSLVGEAGREAVLPLERNTGWMDELAGKLAAYLQAGGGPSVVEVHVGNELLTRQVIQGVNRQTRQTGRCPIYI